MAGGISIECYIRDLLEHDSSRWLCNFLEGCSTRTPNSYTAPVLFWWRQAWIRPQNVDVMLQDGCGEGRKTATELRRLWCKIDVGRFKERERVSQVYSCSEATLPLPLQTLCCWTTDACDVSGASSKSAWQEKSHLSVTFLCYLIMIRCDDVVTSCTNVVHESLIELCGWKAKTVIFHRNTGLSWGPKWNGRFFLWKIIFFGGGTKIDCQFYSRKRAIRAWAALPVVLISVKS